MFDNIKSRLISLLVKSIGDLIIGFKLNYLEFHTQLESYLISKTKEKNWTQSQIVINLGIKRSSIRKYKDNKRLKNKFDHSRVVIQNLKNYISDYFLRNNCEHIPTKKVSDFFLGSSFNGEITSRTCINHLIENDGFLIEKNQHLHKNKDSSRQIKSIQHFEVSLNVITRFINTCLYNINLENSVNSTLIDNGGLYQMSAYSTQINPSKFGMLQNEMNKELRNFIDITIEILEKYEEDVQPGTYNACGLSMFLFKD